MAGFITGRLLQMVLALFAASLIVFSLVRLSGDPVDLIAPDADVPLPLQEVFRQVYEDGRYYRRVRYEDPCEPPLPDEDQSWTWDCWNQFRGSHPELFPA